MDSKNVLLSIKNRLNVHRSPSCLPFVFIASMAAVGPSAASSEAMSTGLGLTPPPMESFTVASYESTQGVLSQSNGSKRAVGSVILTGGAASEPTKHVAVKRSRWVKLPLSKSPLELKKIETLLAQNNPHISHRHVLEFAHLSIGSTTRGIKAFDKEVSPSILRATRKAADAYGLPQSLFLGLIDQESRFNPNARSSANAIGLGQILPSTALWLVGKGAGPHKPEQIRAMESRLKDPEFNLELSARYFSYLLALHKYNIELALAAYNAGPGTVQRFKGVPPYPETHKYIKNVKLKTIGHFKTALSQSAGIHPRSGAMQLAQANLPGIYR